MRNRKHIYFAKVINLKNGVFIIGEVTGGMLNLAETKEHFLILKEKFIRDDSFIRL